MSGTRRRRSAVLTAVTAAVLVVSGCEQDTPQGHGDGDADLAHIHGLGVNPKDGKLYVASHHGLFLVTGKGEPEQIAGRTQDFMGFTVVGPDHFLGSGHPGPDDGQQPPNLGLIESTDAGKTWKSLSLSGQADFHAMEAADDRVYGFDSQTGQIMVSKDNRSWDQRARLPLADIAVSPDDPDVLLATTEQGVQRSTDGGKSFTPLPGSPTLFLIDWAAKDWLAGVTPDGQVQVSADDGKTWDSGGSVSGQPQAILAHGDKEVYVATDEAIYHSDDNGKTFREFHTL